VVGEATLILDVGYWMLDSGLAFVRSGAPENPKSNIKHQKSIENRGTATGSKICSKGSF
jgi:hypothetical protein